MKQFFKRTLYFFLILFLLLNIIAAFHAWKFTHFYPAGAFKNKKPEQMNTWEKVKMVTLGVRLSKSIIRLKPNIPYETVYLNNHQLEAWYIPAAKAKGTVIIFHGYNACKDAYLPEAYYFHELGYNAFMVDFRGNGNSAGNTCTVGYKEAEDVQFAYEYIHDKHIILWGMSMGAAAILRAVPVYKLHPDKIILESSFATLTDAVKGRMRAVHLPGTPLAQMLTFWGGVEQQFWSLGFKPEEYAKQIEMPALVCWGTLDTRVTREETNLIYRHLKKKELVIFDKSGHQSFCRNEPLKWKTTIKTFLK